MNKKTDWFKIPKRKCRYCGSEFNHNNYEKLFEYNKRKYCGNECKLKALADFNRGKKAHNNNQKDRVCSWCGKKQMVSPAYANRPFCSRKCMGEWISKKQIGQNHWNWQGGITEKPSRDVLYPGYKEWRKSVYARDGYKCVLCGRDKSGELQAHHIKPRAIHKDLILDVSNGLTVCKKCHKEIHYGKL